jgi:hypothetical protein
VRIAIGALIAAIELFPLNLYAPLFVLASGEILFFLFLMDARIGMIAFRLLSASPFLTDTRSIRVADFWIEQIRRIFRHEKLPSSEANEVPL